MKIYQMTATFGKLEHAQLTLEPGLNVIYAPNEWGKSTWCAFMLAMFYGLDTRAKSKKTAVADKEHYAPWSGSPMSGRIDLCWLGRDITIERRTRGRVPLGVFSAYETHTGIRVPEITAANCGQMLLGVEQSVYRRGGFIRLSELPVTQDESLMRRLNALVTTGEEGGDADRLGKNLRELKNRCRYNKTGLLPQAEEEAEKLQTELRELRELNARSEALEIRQEELSRELDELYNHREHLQCKAAAGDAEQLARARAERDRIRQELDRAERQCAGLPSREETQEKIQKMREFQAQWASAMMEQDLLPKVPEPPEAPAPFSGMAPDDAAEMVRKDTEVLKDLKNQKNMLPLIVGSLALAAAIGLVVLSYYLPAVGAALVGAASVTGMLVLEGKRKKKITALLEKYGSPDPTLWIVPVNAYRKELEEYRGSRLLLVTLRGDLDKRLEQLRQKREALCGTDRPEKVAEVWHEVLGRWDTYETMQREAEKAQTYLEAMEAIVRPVRRPERNDFLTCSAEETRQRIADREEELQNNRTELARCRGRMEAVGDLAELESRLESGQERIRKLEAANGALTLAQEALAQASTDLQRQFAPRISRRAQELMGRMTGGRYDRVQLGEDFMLRAGAEKEDTLHDVLWRSEGTVDQLYLALRLAVSEALTPEAPLVLDDVLVRFDDERLKAAMDIFREEAESRQVILFTCQKREQALA